MTLKFDISQKEWRQTSSRGNQAKYTNGKLWLKADFMGYEGLAEALASDILQHSTLLAHDYIRYQQCLLVNSVTQWQSLGCLSYHFLNTDETFISLGTLLANYGYTQHDIDSKKTLDKRLEFLLSTVKRITSVDITDMLQKLFTLDALILNEDRHLHNIGLIANKTGDFRPTPIFDNGLGFLADTYNYKVSTSPSLWIRQVKAKPISSDFKKQYQLLGKGFEVDKQYIHELLSALDGCNYGKRIQAVINKSLHIYPELFI